MEQRRSSEADAASTAGYNKWMDDCEKSCALVYGIPKSTLHDRVSGKVNHEARVGAPKHLTDEEEEEVVKWLEDVQKVLRTCVL